MASESTLSTSLPAATGRPQACDKVRLRFRKIGELRLVSHRDLMKCFKRALRRANLPIHVSQGFHPMPRMVFAMSLALGIVGLEEVLELELTEAISADEVRQRLAAQMPPGLEIISARQIPVRSAAHVRRAGYRVTVPATLRPDLPGRIADLLAAKECLIERERPERRQFDLRPLLSELDLREEHLEMLLWVTPNGAARPGEVLALLGLSDLVESGAILERHLLEIIDETEHSDSQPPLPAASGQVRSDKQSKGAQAAAPDEHARSTALFPGPMDFDT